MKKTMSLATCLALSVGLFATPPVAEAQQNVRGRRGRMRMNMDTEVTMAAEALGLEPGMTVAEIGAGGGWLTLRLAEYVRPGGRAYANELGVRQVQAIGRTIEDQGLNDVFVVQGAVDDANLPEGAVDALTMRMVYHMMTNPEAMTRSFFRSLKPGGAMLVIEGYPKNGPNAPGVPANRSGMGIDSTIAISEIESAGFELVRVIDRWPNVGYAMVFRKPGRGPSSSGDQAWSRFTAAEVGDAGRVQPRKEP